MKKKKEIKQPKRRLLVPDCWYCKYGHLHGHTKEEITQVRENNA